MRYLIFLLIVGIFIFVNFASAINYPIPELGNCASESACQTYCDNVENIEVCLNAAEKYGLMSSNEVAEAKKILPFLKAGTTPGKCKSEKECNNYCDKERRKYFFYEVLLF